MIESVIFDYSNTLEEVERGNLYPEVPSVLDKLKVRGIKMALVSRASDVEQRLSEFDNLDLRKYFDVIDVVLVGNNKDLSQTVSKMGVKPEDCLVVGDRVKSEILEGNKIGCKTAWIRRGRFAQEMPDSELERPDFEIKTLEEIFAIIR